MLRCQYLLDIMASRNIQQRILRWYWGFFKHRGSTTKRDSRRGVEGIYLSSLSHYLTRFFLPSCRGLSENCVVFSIENWRGIFFYWGRKLNRVNKGDELEQDYLKWNTYWFIVLLFAGLFICLRFFFVKIIMIPLFEKNMYLGLWSTCFPFWMAYFYLILLKWRKQIGLRT